MIIFVHAMYSKQELNADSNYVVYTAWVRAMHRLRPDWRFVVNFPDAQSGFKYEDDGFFKLGCVTRVPQRVLTRRSANAMSFDANWYEALYRRVGFDLVWCNLPEIAAQLRYSGRTTREDVSKPSVVAAHNYIMHESLPYEFMEQIALLQVMGSIVADASIFNSEHCLQMFKDTAARYFNKPTVDRALAKSHRIDYGTLEDDLGIKDRPPNDVPIVAYNHRLLTHKNYATTFEVLDELYKDGLRFRLRFMNNTAERLGFLRKFPWVEVALSRNRDEYLEKLRGCDVNVINSQHETFCIAAAESMAMGQPLVAPDGVTFRQITNADKLEYPYLFKKPGEQKAMVRKLLEDAVERKKWGARLSEHVRANYTQSIWAERHAKLFEKLMEGVHVGAAPERLDEVRKELKKNPQGIDVVKLYTALCGSTVNGKKWFGTQTATLTKLVRMVRHLGGKVDMRGGKQWCSL